MHTILYMIIMIFSRWKKSLGNRLKEAQEKIVFSKGYAVDRLGLHKATIDKYASNEYLPSVDILTRMIEIYCEDANYILYGKIKNMLNINSIPDFLITNFKFRVAKYMLNKKWFHIY